MLRAAVVGYGNIGRFVLDALLVSADFEIAGIVSNSLQPGSMGNISVARTIDELSTGYNRQAAWRVGYYGCRMGSGL